MDAFRLAANSPGVQALIDQLADPPELQGIALGVHANYVHLYRNEFGLSATINEILVRYNHGIVPNYWSDACAAAGLPTNLAPIYVSVYIAPDTPSPTSAADFRAQWQVPNVIAGNYLVIIEVVTRFFGMHDRTDHHHPIHGGTSVGTAHRKIGGTLGGLMEDQATGAVYLTSCNHVLVDAVGPEILQRSQGDGGTLALNHVADVTHAIPLKQPAGYGFNAPFNRVDVGLAEVHPGTSVGAKIRLLPLINTVSSTSTLNLGDDVVFVGKESDYISARIFRYIARMKVDIFRNSVQYYFGDVMEIESRIYMYFGSLSQPGDSGAWVAKEQNGQPDEFCGMLFAGNGKTSLCCFTETVLNELAAASPTSSFSIY